MFGNSSWTNPQQNQQQQQQPGTSAFGQGQGQGQQQPSAFGSGGTTAGFGGFGQTQQQQQQQPVNPMFGGGTTSTGTAGTSGFGSFGGGGTSAFGAPKPSGFGAFGGGTTGTSAFGGGGGGGGGAFGQNTGSTSAFGQPSGGTSAFGSGGTGLFGQKPAAPTTTFGSTSTGPTPGASDVAVPPVTTGSANPPYQVFSEKDTNTAGQPTLNYQSISCMPAYRGTSFEEVRVQDYLQGRRTAGGFGQSATFGLQPSQSTSTAFGQPATGTSGFGGFGQNTQQGGQQQTSAFGSFGQPSTSQAPAFGAGTGTSGFGGFGQSSQQQQQQQQQQPQQPAGTGLFGGTGAFGQNAQQQQGTGTSAFGAFGQNANQPKPFGTFGQPSGTSAFGSGTGFGQASTQPAGQTSTGLFGQPANQQQGTSVFGSFGQNKPAFGQPASQPTSAGFGLFGQNQQNQQQQQPQQQGQQPPTGLFGGTQAGTGLFGQNQQQQQQGQPGQQPTTQPSTGLFGQPASQPSTNLFGGGGTGTNLFGTNNNQNKPAFGTGLFGNTQTAPTGTSQPSTGLFAQPLGQANQQPSTGTGAFGSSLFGQRPATTNAFGQSTAQPASTGFGSSLFGASQLGGAGGGLGQSVAGTGGPQGAGTLTASVAQPVQENLPIFSLLNSSQPASLAPPPKKMSNFFVDVPTRSPLGISTSRLSNAGKLRGFGVSQSSAGLYRTGGLSSSTALSRNGPNTLTVSRADSKSLLGPDAFRTTPQLGSEPKSSPKKLVLNKKIDPNEVFGRSMAKGPATNGTKVEFNPAMSMAAREKEAASKPVQPTVPTGASTQPKKSPTVEKDIADLQVGDYYVKPPLEVLRKLSNRELSSFEGLAVGRKGFGEIQFLDPVDLTTLPRLKDLLGKFVEFEKQECIVYPETVVPESEKPPPGEGINVRSRITLEACWPLDKATGEPIKDRKHPAFLKRVKNLQITRHTHFENYDMETGNWTFTVEGF